MKEYNENSEYCDNSKITPFDKTKKGFNNKLMAIVMMLWLSLQACDTSDKNFSGMVSCNNGLTLPPTSPGEIKNALTEIVNDWQEWCFENTQWNDLPRWQKDMIINKWIKSDI